MGKKYFKKVVVPVPASNEEAIEFIRKLGEHQRKLTQIQTNLNKKIEEIKAQAVTDGLPHQKAKEQLFEGIFIFAQSHRDELTEGGKTKTVSLPTGEISWRLTPPAVSLENVEKIIGLCKSSGLKRFIRIQEEVDKEAMLREPEIATKIKGVAIGQREEFIVKPSETEIEIVRKLKKALE